MKRYATCCGHGLHVHCTDKMPRKPVDFFGDESPLFAPKKKVAKKKTVKKKVVVKKRARKKLAVEDLFDANKPKSKKRGPKSHAQLAEEKIIAENKRVAKKRRARDKNLPKKRAKVYPKITSPKDCKNILPAFKKKLNEQWVLLEDGTLAESSMVASYINGVMTICKDSRPKEYDELYVLRLIAKRIYNERTAAV